jgi:hypothetical protein
MYLNCVIISAMIWKPIGDILAGQVNIIFFTTYGFGQNSLHKAARLLFGLLL